MEPASYDRWYETPRGKWIGQREIALILELLRPCPGETLLDVGCGTGFFTRGIGASMAGAINGVDVNPEWVAYARRRHGGRASYEVGDARALPYADASFDLVVSVTALCFIDDQVAAAREILRVARRRFAIGLLNRNSILWLQKGRGGGHGGYCGAHWHTVRETRRLFRELPARNLQLRTAIQIPGGGPFARFVERAWPPSLSYGAFILAVGDVAVPKHPAPNTVA